MNIYSQSAVADIQTRTELFNEKYLQILRDLNSSEISGKIDTNIRLVVNRNNVDYAIQKVQELAAGGYISELKKQELVNGFQRFKTMRTGLSYM